MAPSFYLKAINPSEILDKLNNGYFNRPAPNLSKIVIAQNNNTILKNYPEDQSDGVFTIKDKYDNPIIIATTEHNNLKMISVDIHYVSSRVSESNKGTTLLLSETLEDSHEGCRHICDSCKDEFKNEKIGYPISYEKISFLNKEGRYQIIHVFYTKGEFCSFQCALYWMNLIKIKTELIHFMFNLYHPGKEQLKPCNDPHLRICNGGSLTDEEWRNEKHIYTSNNKNIKSLPIKTEYIRTNNLSYIPPNKNEIYQ